MHEISLQRAWERHVTPDHHSVWVRWFQMPTNVVVGERVYLVADPCHLPNMWLNGDALADMECEEGIVCISELLGRRNCLIFCQVERTDCSNKQWFMEIQSGQLSSDRHVLPKEFGKVGLKIG